MGLVMGESPPAELPANDTSSTEQFIVIFQDFVLGQPIGFFAPYTSKLMRHSPSGKHPYLAVRFRGKPNQTIQEMQFNVVPTDYDMCLIIHTNVVRDERGLIVTTSFNVRLQ